MHTVVEMPEFIRRAKKLGISDEERENIINGIAANPAAGDEIAGTGGMRKVRVAGKGKGKSGGYRLITFFSGVDIPVFLITVYAKSDQSNITDKDKNAMKALSSQIVNLYKKEEK
jgi:hypothetical protein